MSISDKSLLGAIVGVLVIGLIQRATTREEPPAPLAGEAEETRASSTIEPNATSPSNTIGATPRFDHVVDIEFDANASLSPYQQRAKAMREHDDRTALAQPVPSDFDLLPARASLRETLFSASFNGGSNTLSDAEKEDLIDSGHLPW